MSLRTILLIGRDPYQLHNALRQSGFTAAAGFQIIEAGGVSAAETEMKSDDSIVAVVSSDNEHDDDVRKLTERVSGFKFVPASSEDVSPVVQMLVGHFGLKTA